ncbi:TOM1-like protein [Drosera capensis]
MSSSSPEKSALSSLSDRLRAAPSHLSRLLTPKLQSLKSILTSPTPESRFVDDATSSTLTAPDWGLNLRICSLINAGDISGTEIVRSIKRKIADPGAGMLGLELLEVTAMNCEKVFSEIASEKVLEEMVRLVEGTCEGGVGVEVEVRVRVLEMIRGWGESRELEYLPVFRHTYENLLQRGLYSNADNGARYTLDSYIGQEPISPPENYPIPADTEVEVASGTNFGNLSVEKKKEFLEIMRNSIEVLSSLLNSVEKPDLAKDELTMSMLERCRDSQPVLQRLVETTTDDEAMLSQALSLHDELEQVITKFEKIEVSREPEHGPVESNTTIVPILPVGQVEGRNIEVFQGADGDDAGTRVSDPVAGVTGSMFSPIRVTGDGQSSSHGK